MEKMNERDRRVHEQFSTYGRCAREWMRRCVLLLPEVERRRIWKKRGCSSIYEYAAKLAGMSRGTVEDGLRIMKKVEVFPALKPIVETRGLNRVRPVLGIITPETQHFWAEKAKSMAKNTLETYVKNYRSESRTSTGAQPVKLSMELTAETVEKLKALKGEGSWEELMGKLLAGEVEREAAEELAPEFVKTTSRHIPVKIQRHVRRRTGGLCAYPACSRVATSLHHTQRWGLEKVHDPARLHGLCTEHERLAHLGLIENEEVAPRMWRVREEADRNAHKRFVDQFVALYRPT